MFFMGGGTGDGWVRVASGKPNGKSTFDILDKGTVRISGTNERGTKIERIVHFDNGEVIENIFRADGSINYHVRYGQFEKVKTEHGTEIVRFNPKCGSRRKHGKARRYAPLFGKEGICHSWYKQGRLTRQIFIYDNLHKAYEYRLGAKRCIIKDPQGIILYDVSGILDGNGSAYDRPWQQGGMPVFDRPMPAWFSHTAPFEVKNGKGKVVFSGQYDGDQHVGKWIENGKTVYYVKGVPIPEKYYNADPKTFDPLEILSLSNVQLRMALCSLMGNEQIAEAGKIIHKEGDMRLISVNNLAYNILRVKCPSTKSFYYLNVPKDSTKCEQARQWTFGVGDTFTKPIKFTKET